MGIKHAFTSTKDQGSDSSLVSKDEWNADHVGEPYPSESPDAPADSPNAMDDEFVGGSLDAKWTTHLHASATATVSASHLGLWAPYNVQTRNIYVTQPAPSGTWRVRAKLSIDGTFWNHHLVGLIAQRGSGDSTKTVTAQFGYWSSQQGTLLGCRYTKADASQIDYEGDLYNTQFPFYAELEYDGTNVIFRSSVSGAFYGQIWKETVATHLGGAPEQVGIMFVHYPTDNSTNCEPYATADWFRRMA